MAKKSWFFQYDPKIYRTRDALDSLGDVHWSVKQNASDLHSGDRVFVWASGATGGLVAEAIVTTEPGSVLETEAERQFYVADAMPPSDLGVRIGKVRTWPEPALTRDELKAEPGLSKNQLLRMPRGTIFPISAEEDAVLDRLLAPEPKFAAVLSRYRDEGVVFQSPERGALYCVQSVDDQGADIRRLSADEPARLTFSLHDKRLNELQSDGSVAINELDGTSAVRTAFLQSPELGLAADRELVRALSNESSALNLFCDLLHALRSRSDGEPQTYKPLLLACVVEVVGDGTIGDHRLPFDTLLPRYLAKAKELDIVAGEEQAGLAFFHLTNDLFWNLAYHDVDRRIDAGNVGVDSIRERVSHAVLKEPFRWLLRKGANRQRILAALATAWRPVSGKSRDGLGIWWVNQSGSFEKERVQGTIWCPQYDKAGKSQHHWTNVSKVQAGDVFFHAAKGEVRAISVATTAAMEGAKPQELAIDDEWQRPGWHADVTYSDLATPIVHGELKEMLRRTLILKGPFNSSGVQTGYLFPLNARAVCLLSEKLVGEKLPTAISDRLQQVVRSQWSEFIKWGRQFFETEGILEREREWKIAVATKAGSARKALEQDSAEWLKALKRAFQNDGATNYRSHDDLLKWIEKNPDDARVALKKLWDGSSTVENCIDNFWSGVPDDVVSGHGSRATLASFLLGERDPTDLPLYRFEPVTLAASITGCWRKCESPGDIYVQFLEFLDRVRKEAAQRGLLLKDRLDAQTLVWCVVKHSPPDEWTEQDRVSLLAFREGKDPIMETNQNPVEVLADELLVERQFVEDTRRLLESKGQVIFYGPPGTGKTYLAQKLAEHYAGGMSDGVEIVQFHPSYAYEDFVEGYRPNVVNGKSGFVLTRGPLRRLARRAKQNPDRKFVLIIDELNRGNVAKVFGELYFLLEYRNEAIRLQYDHRRKFSLPENLWIIGTMNTADRSIALMDAALRRRFYFLPFFPDLPPIKGLLRRWLTRNCQKMSWVADVVDRANEVLGDRHSAIGPSHFMKKELDDAWLRLIWEHSVLPFLAEQFFGEEERLLEFALEKLKTKPTNPAAEQ